MITPNDRAPYEGTTGPSPQNKPPENNSKGVEFDTFKQKRGVMNDKSPSQYMRGLRTGRLEVVNAVRTILEESEQRISILTILATLERLEQEVIDL